MAISAGSVYSELILDGSKYFSTLEKAEKQVETFQKKLENAGKNMEKAGEKLSKYVTAPIVGIGTVATKLGLDFEAAMSEVGAISGATGDDLARLEEKAREFSAADVQQPQHGYGGWETEQSWGCLV